MSEVQDPSSNQELKLRPKTAELVGGSLVTVDSSPFPRVPSEVRESTKLVFINPDLSTEHSIAKYVPSPYHGTRRMKHYLEAKHDIDTAVVDFHIHDRAEVMQDLARFQPPVIGFAFFYDTLPQDLKNLWAIRQACPDSFIIVGGIEATARSAEYIAKLPIDGLLRGEGELPVAQLVSLILSAERPLDKAALIERARHLPGWMFRTPAGEIVKGPPAKTIDEEQYAEIFGHFNMRLEDYRPYWEFINTAYDDELLEILDITPRMIRLVTSNYCPYNCTFCVSTTFLKLASEERKVRVVGATAEELVAKVERILAEDPEIFIYFDDENFMAMPQRARDFCDLVVSRGIQGKFGCRATAQMVSADICKRLARAGFRVIAFGAESWDVAVLRDFSKRLENRRSDIAIENIQAAGMKCSVNVILFAPAITREGLIATCDKVLEYVGKECNIGMTSFIAPYPGTHYYKSDKHAIVQGELAIPGTNELIDFPQAVLPSDPEMRELAEAAQERGRGVLSRWQTEYKWKYPIIPREVSVLALVYSVFVELGLIDFDERGPRIEEIVERILTNKRQRFVRDTAATRFSVGDYSTLNTISSVENPY